MTDGPSDAALVRPRIFGVDVDNLTLPETVDRIAALVQTDRAHSVVTVNLDHILKLREDEDFRAAYSAASLCVADGAPFVLMSRLDRTPLKERVAGSDLIAPICARAARDGFGVFVLGTTDARLKAATQTLSAQHPGLNFVGTYAPPMGFDTNETAQAEAIARLKDARADLVLLALGAPKQEKFAAQAIAALDHGVFLNIGAGLDFLSGDVRRAPAWMQKSGTEWLYRALSEPARLGPRYLKIISALPGLVKQHYDAKKASAL